MPGLIPENELPDINTLDDARVRIVSLEARCDELEQQMLVCLKWMRIQAESQEDERQGKTPTPNLKS